MMTKTAMPLPPRLSMAEYVHFVGENWKNGNLAQMNRQKEIEERIEKPFCIPAKINTNGGEG